MCQGRVFVVSESLCGRRPILNAHGDCSAHVSNVSLLG